MYTRSGIVLVGDSAHFSQWKTPLALPKECTVVGPEQLVAPLRDRLMQYARSWFVHPWRARA
jgi:hypothetical protein